MIDSIGLIIPNSGRHATHIWNGTLGRLAAMPESDASGPAIDIAKLVVAENLVRLMDQTPHLRTIKLLSAASGVSTGTIDRIRRAEVAAGVDTLRMIAEPFGLDAWKLLVPHLDPTNPPILAAESERLKQLYATLKKTAEAIGGHLRTDGNTASGLLDAPNVHHLATAAQTTERAGIRKTAEQKQRRAPAKKKRGT